MKKIIVVLLMAVIAMASLSVTSFASPYDDAVAIESGKTVKGKLPGTEGKSGITYTFTAEKEGTLTVNCSVGSGCAFVYVFDDDGAYMTVETLEIKSGRPRIFDPGGEGYSYFCGAWNSNSERFSAVATYKIEKGKYYISVVDDYQYFYGNGDGTVKLTATYPTEEKEVKISYLGLTMKKGDTLQLSAILTGGKGKTTWSSSKKRVASITSSGKVKAKKKGSTIITAKCGDSVVKLKITVK